MNAFKGFFKGFSKGTKDFGHNITALVNSILLFFVYLIGVGLTSIFAKIFRKHFINIKIDKSRSTYWDDYNLDLEKIDNYYRQF